MRRRFGAILILLAACTLASQANALAQSSSPTPAPAPDPKPKTPDPTITLGQSVVPLYGPWKFQIGDSPIDPKNGKPLWAEPGFDDSKWESVDLTPPTGKFNPAQPDLSWLPGWRAKGHPNYWGWAWYRLSVPLAQNNQSLALAGPANVDGAYQVFSNGDLVGGMGDFGMPGKTPTDLYVPSGHVPAAACRTRPTPYRKRELARTREPADTRVSTLDAVMVQLP